MHHPPLSVFTARALRRADDTLRQITIGIDFLNSYYPTDYICRPGYLNGRGLFPNSNIEKLSDDFTSVTQGPFQNLSFFTHRMS